MKIQGNKTVINANPETVFNFLIEPSNIELLLPADKISDFKATENGCSFKVQGGILIPLIYTVKDSFSTIRLTDGGTGPFPYEMVININKDDSSTSSSVGNIEFNAQINAFMKMIVQKPLTALFETMTVQLKKHFA